MNGPRTIPRAVIIGAAFTLLLLALVAPLSAQGGPGGGGPPGGGGGGRPTALGNIRRIRLTYLLDTELVAPGSVTVRARNGVAYAVGLGPGNSADYDARLALDGAGNQLSYQLYDSSVTRNVLKDLGGAADGSGLLSGVAGTTDTQNFDIVVFQGQPVPAGLYTELVDVTLYEGLDGSGGIVDNGTLEIEFTVEPSVAVSLVASGAPYDPNGADITVDFGQLTAGIQRSIDMIVRANIGYAVDITSANSGVMAHTDGITTSVVAYTFAVDGTVVSLAGGTAAIANEPTATTLDGTRYALLFTSGDPSMALDGLYRDDLTITVTAQ